MADTGLRQTAPRDWLSALQRYFLAFAALNLVWEFSQMPLFTLWQEGSWSEIIFAGLHCTAGDLLITASAMLIALFLFGKSDWPSQRAVPVLVALVVIGLGYTIFSEWLNIVIRKSWAYSELMPVIPVIGTGISPFLQWIATPFLAYRVALASD